MISDGTNTAARDPARDPTTAAVFDVPAFLFSIEIHRKFSFYRKDSMVTLGFFPLADWLQAYLQTAKRSKPNGLS